ncbi:DMT family transporter [Ottowia thiooxydans]|uniref:Drug/metabolite transporter (DMT)-like permease n=1 Tax=Ottowia thiooxydans TaxID=219182 RepID=A0ABV2Q731_9BURK
MQNQVQGTALPLADKLVESHHRQRQGQWLLIAGGLLLGTVGVFAEEANQPPLITVWFRCAFGALALLAWGLATGRTSELRIRGKSRWIVLATGGFMILNWALFFAAIPLTSIGMATIVFHIQPVWLIVYSAVVLHETVPTRQRLATVVALSGLVLTTGLWDNNSIEARSGQDYVVGLLLCLGGSLSYAAVTILAKREKVVSSFAMAWWQCAVGVVVLAWAPLIYGWPHEPSTWAWLAGLGILHTGLAYAILFAGMTRLTLGRIAVLQYVYPLSAVLLDWVIYGRTLDTIQLAGVGVMGIALLAIRSR